MKNIHTVTVTGNKNIADGIYMMTLRYKEEEAPEQILPGQFVGVYSKDSARLLPRPISICRWISEDNSIVLVYRVVGAGTEEFASCKKGDTLRILDVLGNGMTSKVSKTEASFWSAEVSAHRRFWSLPAELRPKISTKAKEA